MKVRLIGSHLCQDTLYALIKLKDKGIEIDFCDISASFLALKEFVIIREKDALYYSVKEQGGLGISLFILEDGQKTLSLDDVIKQIKETSGKI